MASNLFGKPCKFYQLRAEYYPSRTFIPSIDDYKNIIRPNMEYIFDFNLSIPILSNESSLTQDIYLFNPGFNTQAGERFDSIAQNWFLASTLFYKSDLYQGIVDTDQVKSLFPNCIDISSFVNNRDTICGLIAVFYNDIAIYMPIARQNTVSILGNWQVIFDPNTNTREGGYATPLFSVIGFGLLSGNVEKCAVGISFKSTSSYSNNQTRNYFSFDSAFNAMNNTVLYTNLGYGNIYRNLLSILDKDYSPPKPDYDPFNPGGNTEPGGGEGDFDDTSDPIDFPNLPTISAVDTGFISLFNPSLSELQSLASYMWNNSLFDIANFQKLFADPMNAILGLSIVPVTVPNAGAQPVKVGNIATSVNMNKAAAQYIEVDCGTLNVNEFWGAYLDYAPYTKSEIYLPYCGTHTIDVDDIMGKSVHVKYHVDILSGACCAYVKCGDSVLYQFSGQCSSSIPISGTDFTQMVNGVLSAAVSIGSMVATGGASAPLAVPALANTAVNGMKPSIEKSGAISGTSGMLAIQKPYMILTRPKQALPSNQNMYTGYPSYVTVTLSEINGYTEVESIHLEGVSGTDSELDEIVSLLKSGVIL